MTFEQAKTQSKHSSSTEIWAALALVLLSLTISLTIAEFGIRLLIDAESQKHLPHFGISEELQSRLKGAERVKHKEKSGTTSYPGSFDIHDPYLGWRVRENANVRHINPGLYEVSIKTNAFGLRGTYPSNLEKPADVKRIGVFGDSQTFGETVNDHETYISLLNEKLPNTEVLNFGVRGYGVDQMLLYFEQEAAKYDLDIAVLAFGPYHIRRNVTSFLFSSKPYFTIIDNSLELNGIPVPTPEQLDAEDITQQSWQLLDRSVLLRWIWQRVRNLKNRWLFSKYGHGWELTGALLTRFVTSAKAANTDVLLVNIGERYPDLENEIDHLAKNLSVDFINLGTTFRSAANEGIPYVLPNDSHWTYRGHIIVADTLYSYFCDKIEPINCE